MSDGTEALLVLLLVILPILACIVLIVCSAVRAQREWKAFITNLPGFVASQALVGATKSYGAHPKSGIAVDEKSRRICLIDYVGGEFNSRFFTYRDILSCEIIEKGRSITRTSRSSQVAGTIVGGLLLGPAGAVIGGLSGAQTTSREVEELALKIIVNDTKRPVHMIRCSPREMEEATRWHGVISVLIRQADEEDERDERDRAKSMEPDALSAPLIADELSKLADLRDREIITQEQFESRKNKLLST